MPRGLNTPSTGLHVALSESSSDAPRVEVCPWIDVPDGVSEWPRSGTPAVLKIGAEGLHLRALTRTWYLPYRELQSHESEAEGVVLRMINGRCLELRVPAPRALQQQLEASLTTYARHAILAQRLPDASAPSTPTSHLLSAFENPTTPPEQRLAIAQRLGTRPLERGDALYLQRIVRDIADAELARSICDVLDIDLDLS